jgi:Phytanoyl-CoA hydroxylase-interacting protein C-terminus
MMTLEELKQLYAKALDYADGEDATECCWLYRNQSEEYFNNVLSIWNGQMKVHMKDQSGDPRSPINGRLRGLFFLATHSCGKPDMSRPLRLENIA